MEIIVKVMRLCVTVFFVSVAYAQSASQSPSQSADKPTFEIASVQVSPRATWAKTPPNAMQGGFLVGDRYEIHRATMLDLIHLAWQVDADKIYGGPSWLDYDKFDIVAKTAPGTRAETLRRMLQSLLAERFQLVVMPDTKPLPAYVLSAGKDQTRLKAAEGASAEGCKNAQTRLNGSGPPTAEIRCQSVTMDEFASGMRRLATAFFERLPVVNSTHIEGAWDIDLKYPARIMRITPSGIQSENGNSLFEAVEKQLGLKLELGKTPQQVLSVASAREQPTRDRAGAADALPPLPPPQFEVAAIRVCDPKAPAVGGSGPAIVTPRIEPGGRVTATCYPLLLLLRQALNLTASQDIVGLPKSLQGGTIANRISITARAPAGTAPNEVTEAAQMRDILNPLLKSLLVDRYKLTYHYEDRPADALTLVATKPKLTKADTSGRTGCSPSNQAGLTKLTCRNITMAQFAEQIPGIYPAARYPVVDGTYLDGAWDFAVEYNPVGVLLQQLSAQQSAAGARGGDATANSDIPEPAGPTNLAEAIEKQIGLKLETHKRPAPVLVIDHMEDEPTDN